ncbi:MAG: glycerol-3-phosphate 1-O-acyltransferase PlsY [Lachnospiraceae bacterium]|jgi:glycerol-3-phosphate acyltransferase PlsY|nr:glycerol-3-phosphate 1-O-acyltransferase PlsY [Lachnospiraceae bacterium]
MERLISLAIGYLFGIFQTAYIYGRLNGIDIREHGSGNAGTTNALRVLGKKAGVIVLLGDVAKTVLAVVAVRLLFGRQDADWLPLLGMYAAAGAILGHNFPVQLGFKGGKGIACTAGLVLTLGPVVTALEASTFLLTVFLTRYVSLGSILVVIELVISLVVLGERGYYGMDPAHRMEFYIVCAVLSAMAVYRHRANIVRLLHGTESKIFQKKTDTEL